MAKQRKTGTAAGKAASQILRDNRYSDTAKKAAASALSQRAPKNPKNPPNRTSPPITSGD